MGPKSARRLIKGSILFFVFSQLFRATHKPLKNRLFWAFLSEKPCGKTAYFGGSEPGKHANTTKKRRSIWKPGSQEISLQTRILPSFPGCLFSCHSLPAPPVASCEGGCFAGHFPAWILRRAIQETAEMRRPRREINGTTPAFVIEAVGLRRGRLGRPSRGGGSILVTFRMAIEVQPSREATARRAIAAT